MEEQAQLTFQISIWRPWILALLPFALLMAVGVLFAIMGGHPAVAVGFLLAFAGIAVLLLLLISLVVRISRWHVDPRGIGGRNNMLTYHRLDWSEIASVEPWLLPGYRYVQINSADRRWVFWLPLFLTNMTGLRSAVARYAPPGNPLRSYLEKHPNQVTKSTYLRQ